MNTMKRAVALILALTALFAFACVARAEQVGLDRTKPAAPGEAISMHFVRDDVAFDVTITLESTVRGKAAEEAMELYQVKTSYSFKPFPGDDFSVSKFNISCVCDDPNAPLELEHYDFDAISQDGTLYEYIYVDGNRFTNPTIYSGGSCDMIVAIPAPANTKVGLRFDDFYDETPAAWFFDDAQME